MKDGSAEIDWGKCAMQEKVATWMKTFFQSRIYFNETDPGNLSACRYAWLPVSSSVKKMPYWFRKTSRITEGSSHPCIPDP